jgi:lipopolysaccharide export LptBFGC system permease protein LptF
MMQRARGKSSSFGKTLALILAYYAFIGAAGMLEKSAPLAMAAVFWAPNVLGLLLAAYIFWRTERSMELLPGWMRLQRANI